MTLPQFHHCDCEMCEWMNFGTFFKFPSVVRIYARFFMHCRNRHSDSHANHVIKSITWNTKQRQIRTIDRHIVLYFIYWPKYIVLCFGINTSERRGPFQTIYSMIYVIDSWRVHFYTKQSPPNTLITGKVTNKHAGEIVMNSVGYYNLITLFLHYEK